MLPKYHLLFGAIGSLVIFLIFKITLFQSLVIFFSSFLLDFDHYLVYVFRKKDLSLKNAIDYFLKKRKKRRELSSEEKRKFKRPIFLFHGIEFWLIVILLAFINNIFLFVFIGIMIHMFLDYVDIIYLREPFYSKFSLIYVWLKNKNKEELVV